MKEKHLFIVCSKTGRLARCEHGGKGYKIDQFRT